MSNLGCESQRSEDAITLGLLYTLHYLTLTLAFV